MTKKVGTPAFWITRIVSILLGIGLCFGADRFLGGISGDLPYRLTLFAGLYVTLAVSLNLINGITGQFSVGHAAFYMVGAYVAGILSKTSMMAFKAALPFGTNDFRTSVWLFSIMLAAALVAAFAGLFVGLPSLRLRGDYLAIVTLGFGEILRIIAQNIQFSKDGQEIVAGAYGIQSVPKIFDLWLVLMLAVFSIALCRNLLKTAHGLPFLSVREDEVASSAMGVDVTRTKVTAFVIGAALAGAAGALFIHYDTYASPSSFKMEVSFLVLTMVVLGGTGSVTGATVGAILLYLIPESLRFVQDGQGESVRITAGVLAGAMIAVIAATVAIRWLVANDHSEKTQKRFKVLGTVGATFLLAFILGKILDVVPAFHAKTWNFTELRWAILASVLIIIMMLRPEGIFAHHELSLDRFFKRLPQGMTG